MGWQRLSPLQLAPDCRYIHWRNVRWIDGELEPTLVEQIEQLCAEHAIDTVLPADYPTGLLLSQHGSRILHARVAPLPNADVMRTLNDKWQFSAIVSRLGLPQPRTELASSAHELMATSLPFPIITKPVDKWASVGFQVHFTREELQQRIASGKLAASFPLLVQEFIPGRDVGFAFVARHGQLVACSAFEEVQRGTRRYFDAPSLREHVARLLKETGYHGVGEIDTRYDPSQDQYRLLEVNPRFWASVLYATHAGMNFPKLVLELDELSDKSLCHASAEPVRLSAYELGMARGALLVEQAANTLLQRGNLMKRAFESVRDFGVRSVVRA